MDRQLISTRIREDEARRARDVVVPRPASLGGDHSLNPSMMPGADLIPAAVLVPLVDRPEGMTVLLTQRTDHLHDHAGQVSFPGGRVELDDVSHEAAALRETEEEVGLKPDRVELVGRLDYYIVRSGYKVTPVVGFVQPPFEIKPDPFEVADVFEVPLSFLMDTENHRLATHTEKGEERSYYEMPYNGFHIWGATAGMLVNLSTVLNVS